MKVSEFRKRSYMVSTQTRATTRRGNAILWKFAPDVSWLWWNVLGFFVAFGVGALVSLWTGGNTKDLTGLVWYRGVEKEFNYEVNWPKRYGIMVAYSGGMIALCAGLSTWL